MTLDKTKETKGKLWWKYRWISICSIHGFEGTQIECNMCQTGIWSNLWISKISSLIYKLFPKLWIWYMNRPNSKARKQIEEWFPKLKKDVTIK